ncbi:hypothetical protein BDS110ZK4_26870 [Bradyrhizobium diazoefficiens]|uniref:GIY-YIG domain-containing protein n=1 Tax=Bradyrhizobium diazoefficiens TaxID=1355477 RepID=A0A809ZGD8_9BRAD|nr:hypothetical protein XF4B_48400 [Bradyrhizobium diazoefficiens]
MRADQLSPKPSQRTRFAWSHHVTVPDKPGCYALVTYNGDVIYVGLATGSIRSRMGSHLDTEAKRKGTHLGVPFWFDYLVGDSAKVAAIERGWMNQAILADGEMPSLNKIYSPL